MPAKPLDRPPDVLERYLHQRGRQLADPKVGERERHESGLGERDRIVIVQTAARPTENHHRHAPALVERREDQRSDGASRASGAELEPISVPAAGSAVTP